MRHFHVAGKTAEAVGDNPRSEQIGSKAAYGVLGHSKPPGELATPFRHLFHHAAYLFAALLKSNLRRINLSQKNHVPLKFAPSSKNESDSNYFNTKRR